LDILSLKPNIYAPLLRCGSGLFAARSLRACRPPEEVEVSQMASTSSKAASRKTGPKKQAKKSVDGPTRFTKEEEISAYREMLLIRRFEEKAGQMYGMGLIGGFCHLYIGQEAVVVGMQMAIE